MLTRDLLRSELFGHERGAFTGAVAMKPGLLAAADGGTVFLDEIGDLAADAQVTLLRFLDSGEIHPVGSQTRHVDVRVVAATHRDLESAIAERSFREDLYHRLSDFVVDVPPLRDRGDDIGLLVEHFIKTFGGTRGLRITPEDMQRLKAYAWPGNVRELRNVIERACVLSKGDTLNLDDVLGGEGATQPALGIRTDLPFKEAKGQLVELFEREYIVDLMKRHKMNLSAAAREAQIDRKHLRELIRKYGLDPRGDLTRDES